MTSLIDVIFLLLLFFMLTSTFSKFAEVELSAAGGAGTASDLRPMFLQLRAETVILNGQSLPIDTLAEAISAAREAQDTPVIVSLHQDVSAQRLTDLLVVLRAVPGLRATVLGS